MKRAILVLAGSLVVGVAIFLGLVAAAPAFGIFDGGPCEGWTGGVAGRTAPSSVPDGEVTLRLRDNETFTLTHPAGRWRSHIVAEGARFGPLGESGHVVMPGYTTTGGGTYCARHERVETFLAEGNGSLVARYWELP